MRLLNVSEKELSSIQEKAKTAGYSRATREVLGLPEIYEGDLLNSSKYYFDIIATYPFDRYLVERSWILAYCQQMTSRDSPTSATFTDSYYPR